jgi:leader peptidase (prepilin peptidase)/N-methyltransferase
MNGPIDIAYLALASVFGLMVGSFLNVVVYRLPKMMERQWARECAEMTVAATDVPAGAASAGQDAFNLMVPGSRCPGCGHRIRWYENIPLFSYAVLRGRCSACGTAIGLRYPVVELVSGAAAAYCVSRWGVSATAAVWFGFSACLLALALIDWDTTLLPDSMTMPLLWAGLLAAQLRWIDVSLPDALWGAVGGYVSLWLVYWGFKLATGKEGMGFGDFKLFAALGVWFGWQALVPIILMSSVIGAAIGIAMKLKSSLREGGYVPFGPFLAGAGLTSMVFGPQAILGVFGI